LDVLQASAASGANAPIVSARGRESLVLNREDLRLEEERRKESKKSAESKKDRDASSSGGTGGGGGSRESGLLSALFGGKKKSANSNSNSDEGGGGAALLSPGGKQGNKRRKSDRNLSPSSGRDFWGNNSSHTSSGGNAHRPNSAQGYHPRDLKADIDYNWTRFSILEERAIYRMAHIKLANPRRALYSQVLLSNFMYSYLAKVQMMHPLVQGAGSSQQSGGQQQQHQQQQHKQGPGQRGQERQSEEFSQYQRWQQVSPFLFLPAFVSIVVASATMLLWRATPYLSNSTDGHFLHNSNKNAKPQPQRNLLLPPLRTVTLL